jgi:hypothetical protein
MSTKPFVTLFAVAVAAVLAGAGCGKKASPSSGADNPAASAGAAKLVGVWESEPEQAEVNGKKVGKPISMTVEFKEGGALRADILIEMSGTWKVVKEEGNTLTVDTEVDMPDFQFESKTEKGKTVEKTKEGVKKEKKTFKITFDGPDAITMTDVDDKPQPLKLKRKK